MNLKNSRVDSILGIATMVLMVASLYLVFIWVPNERTMGVVQRIFYFHVAAAFISFFAFSVVFVASTAHLATRKLHWDRVAASSAELGLVFILMNLISGPIWAKPVWGIWWTWDARLTSTFVLGLIYIAYLMLRAYIPDREKRAKLSAVVGIIGFIDVPIVWMSIRWWRTQHPQPVIMGGAGSGLAPEMSVVLWFSTATFLVLFAWLLRFRLGLESMREELDYYQEVVFATEVER